VFKRQRVACLRATPNLERELLIGFADAGLWQIYPDVIEPLRRWHEGWACVLAVVSNF